MGLFGIICAGITVEAYGNHSAACLIAFRYLAAPSISLTQFKQNFMGKSSLFPTLDRGYTGRNRSSTQSRSCFIYKCSAFRFPDHECVSFAPILYMEDGVPF